MSYDPTEIEGLVRKIVTRTLGKSSQIVNDDIEQRPLIDEEIVRRMPPGSQQIISKNSILTPLARQVALERQIRFEYDSTEDLGESRQSFIIEPTSHTPQHTIAIGADHGGYALKEQLKDVLAAENAAFIVVDCGTHSIDSVDYPDYAFAVARMVGSGQAWRGIIIDGAGIGSCMAANKVPGVRAAMCYDQATAVNSREHNNANVLTLGAGLIGPNLARQIVQTWLQTDFAGGRHARRVDKIDQIGQRFSK